tara:strand:+ start:53 stop:511 length:459 start_codon:yes stop_codon:yes gene_type:complete
MKSVVSKLKSSLTNTTDIAAKAIESVSKESNAMLDSDAIQKLKEQTKNAVKTSIAVCKNLGDVNGDGKIDREDVKSALEKAGYVWDKVDSDLKEALLIGGVAAFGVNAVPLIGQALAIPTFAGATAVFFVRAKISAISVKKTIREENNKDCD